LHLLPRGRRWVNTVTILMNSIFAPRPLDKAFDVKWVLGL